MAGSLRTDCICSGEQIQRYLSRISGPLLDRIDIHVEVLRPEVSTFELRSAGGEPSAAIRARVLAARDLQDRRAGMPNATLEIGGIRKHCSLGASQQDLLQQAAEQMDLSPRSCHRVLKVARTIADLDGAERITTPHLAEAVALRKPALGAGRPGRRMIA